MLLLDTIWWSKLAICAVRRSGPGGGRLLSWPCTCIWRAAFNCMHKVGLQLLFPRRPAHWAAGCSSDARGYSSQSAPASPYNSKGNWKLG